MKKAMAFVYLALAMLVFSAVPVFAGGATLKSVLNNEENLFSVKHDRSMKLDELLALGGDEGPYLKKKDCQFAVVDMDRDGMPEVVIYTGDNVVLHYEDNTVYAHQFGSRQMQMIKIDGSYYGSNSAFGGVYLRIKFNGKTFTKETIGEYDEQEGSYVIQGKKVSKEEFDRLIAELTAPDEIDMVDLTQENIAAAPIDTIAAMSKVVGTSVGDAALYAKIPDKGFPIPMRNGAPIPYTRVVLPEEGYEVTSYVYAAGFMESYKEQLQKAGFIDQGKVDHTESFWRYDRKGDGMVLLVEMSHGESGFYISMYVNKL